MLLHGAIYFIISLLATLVGAIAGLGGGVIIKPVLDLLGHYDVSTINVLSSFTVLSMAVISTIKHFKSGVKIRGLRATTLAIGSIGGGVLGKFIFKFFLKETGNGLLVTSVQSMVLAIILVFTLYAYLETKNIPKYNVTKLGAIIKIGIVLGIVASFLGIGGGPINIAVLAIFFSMDAKSAAVHSVMIILFSQLSKLLVVGIDNQFQPYDLHMLLFMIPGGIGGGLIGSGLNRKLPLKKIKFVFTIIIVLVILLNLYNATGTFR